MKKRIWLLASVMLSVGLIRRYKTNYNDWQRAQAAHLKEGSKLISTASGIVEYSTSGEGSTVLIAHGSPGGYDMGLAFADLLGSQFSYLAPSRPGYLRTPLATGYSPEEQADMYAALLDVLKIEKVAIIGISGGGPSAIQFALRHPERCSSLISISGIAHHYSEYEVCQTLPPLQRIVKQMSTRLTSSDLVLYTVLLLTKLQPKNAAAAALVRTATQYTQRKVGYMNDMREFTSITTYPLHDITVPTFVVHGTNDDEVLFSNAKALAHQVPQAKLLALPDAKHMAFYTHANIVMPALRDFLQQTTRKQETTS